MVLFIFAEKEEYEMILPHIEIIEENIFENDFNKFQSFNLCEYNKKKFYIACSGVGKVNASLYLSNICNICPTITQIVNIGPAASIGNEKIGDYYLIKNSYYYDVDLTSLPNYKIGMLPNMSITFKTSEILNNILQILFDDNIKYCDNATADHFATEKDITLIQNNFKDAKTIDMELTSYIHTAQFYKISIASIKVISDNLTKKSNANDYKNNSLIWKTTIAKLILKILEGGK